MDFSLFPEALSLLLDPKIVVWLFVGFLAGIVVGSIPGLTESTFLAIALPFTIYLDPWAATVFMLGCYSSAEAAGSFPAILLNMPGTPGATGSTFEGYILTQKGFGGEAIGVSVASSSFGTFVGALFFIILGPAFAKLAAQFNSPELFMLAVFGLTAVATLTGENLAKGLMSALLGLLVATTGIDLFAGLPRAHFGIVELYDAVPLLPALLGLFGFAEILRLSNESRVVKEATALYKGMGAPLRGIREAFGFPGALVRSTIVGMIVGIIPGTGASAATVISYGQAKQWSPHPERFGKGSYEGLVATDSANNSVVPGALIPTLTLGIPGSGTTAILMAGLMLQGIRPGPSFYEIYSLQALAIGLSLIVCALLILTVALPLASSCARVAYLPTYILVPAVATACMVGVFMRRQYEADIMIMAVFGVVGYCLKRYGYSPVAFLLGLILGSLLEENFYRTLLVGGLSLLWEKPIALTLLIMSGAMLMLPVILRIVRERKKKSA